MEKVLAVLVIIALVGAIFLIELFLIHWAVNLFYPVTWTQAFGISLLISILGAAFRSKNK
jgi:hypothetical protein